jgi:hypothetical protein
MAASLGCFWLSFLVGGVMSDDPWWDNEDGSWQKYYHALGVVSSRYNRLESTLFEMIHDLQKGSVRIDAILFQKLPNDQRLRWLNFLVSDVPQPQDISDAIDHFISGYSVCTRNRGELMHSKVQAYIDGSETFIATMISRKSGQEVMHHFPLATVRRVADEINRFYHYGSHLHRIMNPLNLPPGATPIWPSALPSKPDVPSRLEGSPHST